MTVGLHRACARGARTLGVFSARPCRACELTLLCMSLQPGSGTRFCPIDGVQPLRQCCCGFVDIAVGFRCAPPPPRWLSPRAALRPAQTTRTAVPGPNSESSRAAARHRQSTLWGRDTEHASAGPPAAREGVPEWPWPARGLVGQRPRLCLCSAGSGAGGVTHAVWLAAIVPLNDVPACLRMLACAGPSCEARHKYCLASAHS